MFYIFEMTGGDPEHGCALDKCLKNKREQEKFIRIIGGRYNETVENHSVSFHRTQCTVGFCTELSSCSKRIFCF